MTGLNTLQATNTIMVLVVYFGMPILRVSITVHKY